MLGVCKNKLSSTVLELQITLEVYWARFRLEYSEVRNSPTSQTDRQTNNEREGEEEIE